MAARPPSRGSGTQADETRLVPEISTAGRFPALPCK